MKLNIKLSVTMWVLSWIMDLKIIFFHFHRMCDKVTINEMLLAASSIPELGKNFELAIFNGLEVLKNNNIKSLPIEPWTEDLLISILAFLAVVAKSSPPQKKRSIQIITKHIINFLSAEFWNVLHEETVDQTGRTSSEIHYLKEA